MILCIQETNFKEDANIKNLYIEDIKIKHKKYYIVILHLQISEDLYSTYHENQTCQRNYHSHNLPVLLEKKY